MRRRIVLLIAAALLITALQSAGALEISRGRMRVNLHEENGRISLFYLENIKEEQYRSLLFRRDPRTTSLGLLLDNRIVTLGSSAEFEQRIEEEGGGASFLWTNSRFRVRQRISFVRSTEEGLADGIRIEVTVHNVSEAKRRVGIHYLFDTHLGERRETHFSTSAGDSLSRETEYRGGSVPRWWLSPAPQHSFEGLRATLRGESLTPPQRVVFANWKRLNESTWNLQVQEERSFNLLPYSINDSAVAHFYEPEQLEPGESRTVSMILGTGTGYVEPRQETEEKGEQETAGSAVEELTESRGEEPPETLEERMIRINDILKAIDSLLAGKEELTGEKVEVLEQKLEELKSRSREQSDSGSE